MNRDQFLDYIWNNSELKGNKVSLKVGDVLRLADQVFGIPELTEFKPKTITVCKSEIDFYHPTNFI